MFAFPFTHLRFANGTGDDFTGRLRKRPRGRPRGSVSAIVANPALDLLYRDEEEEFFNLTIFARQVNARRREEDEYIAAAHGPVLIYRAEPSPVPGPAFTFPESTQEWMSRIK